MQYDAFDYFTIELDPNASKAIALRTEPGPGKSRIALEGGTATIDVDYAHRPVFIIRRGQRTTVTNRLSIVRAATRGMEPDIELVKTYIREGRALASCVPFRGVECVAPSSRIKIAGNEVSTEKFQSQPPGEPLTGTEAVEEAVVNSLREKMGDRRCAFSLSGGTDSTLLVALAKRYQLCDVTAYTANTGAGKDLDFARAAARHLGIRLIEVEIPFTKKQLDIHRRLMREACGPLKPKVGFTMICAAAGAAGFEAIVEGTGPAPVFGGKDSTHGAYWAAEQLRLGHRHRAETFITFALAHGLIDRQTVAKIGKLARQDVSFRDYMFHRFTIGRVYQHVRNASAAMAGMEVVMPFFDHDLGRFLLNDGSHFFEGGRNKSALRKVLAKYVPHEIAYRADNQGLRWPVKRLVKMFGSEMYAKIRASRSFRELNFLERLSILARRDREVFCRCYAAAVYMELCAGGGQHTGRAAADYRLSPLA